MKRKTIHKIYVLLLCATLLFYAGCSSTGGPGKSDDDFKSGTSSLDVRFDSNVPPRQLLQQQQTSVILRLQNEGAFEIENGFLTLNYDKSIISSDVFPMFEAFSLEGRSQAWPRGEATTIGFKVQATNLPQESQVQETQFIATACYDYRTEVFVDVCIEADPYNLRPDEAEQVCGGSEYSPGSSGGNVNVRRVTLTYDIESSQVTPTVIVDLAKSGKDFIFKKGFQADYCTSSNFNSESSKDIIGIQVLLSDRQLFCNTNEVRLIDGKATVTCDGFVLDAFTKNYNAPLTILLDYGVMTSVSKSVEVVRSR